MGKPSVTLRHDEAYLLGGFMLLMTAAIVGLRYATPAAQQSGQLSLFATIPLILCGIACFFWGGFTETLNENGIYIKRPFYSKQYPWSDVTKVSVVTVPCKGGKRPEFSLKIKNRRRSLPIDYTKRSMACITCYYGQPDEDKWAEPPMLM